MIVDHDAALAVVAGDRDERRGVPEHARHHLLVLRAVDPRERHRLEARGDVGGLDQEAEVAVAVLELVRQRGLDLPDPALDRLVVDADR